MDPRGVATVAAFARQPDADRQVEPLAALAARVEHNDRTGRMPFRVVGRLLALAGWPIIGAQARIDVDHRGPSSKRYSR